MKAFNFNRIDSSWQPLVNTALSTVDPVYLQKLRADTAWLPGPNAIFNAFSQPLSNTRFILLGESPYPRQASANGYAFWDQAVTDLWSDKGLSKAVNRATSLRNFIKMLLLAEGLLDANDMSQAAISCIDKQCLIKNIGELFANLLQHGFLLLNASLVLSNQGVKQDAKCWYPFMATLLNELAQHKQDVQLILFGKIAEQINTISAAKQFKQLLAEHPYNLSFIQNKSIIQFFQPFRLLRP